MSVAAALEPAPTAYQRPDCVACCRPYGRHRSPLVLGDALVGCDELIVCDQCWQLAGGFAAVRAKLTEHGTPGEQLEPLLIFDRDVDALLSAASEQDALHPLDRLLVDSGIRWSVLRHIAVPARVDLARRVLERVAPPRTRAADSPEVWITAVEARIREQSGTEFKYNAKRRRWWQISSVFRHCADRSRRPLTWVTQEEIAAAVGCSTRTVRRCVSWLQREGLLFEVVPGCRLPQQAAPDDETAREREERHRVMAEAIAAEEAAITRAHAEPETVRGSLFDAPAADVAEGLRSADLPADSASTEPDPGGKPLVHLAPVYELRLPHSPAEQAEARAVARAFTVVSPLADQQDRRATATLDPMTSGRPVGPSLNSKNAVSPASPDKNGHPPVVSIEDQLKSKYVHPVDNRRASRGSDQTAVLPSKLDHRVRRPQSEAVRAACWLLQSRLDPRVCDGVSIRWLAAQIRGSHLLDRHQWTWEDLADHIHGYPQYAHLPHYIRDCRAWIRARITRATPSLSPTKLRIIQHIERNSPALRRQRQAEAEQTRRADIARRRAAIDACRLCDEQGWIHVPADTPTARCNHDPATGGW